MIPREVELQKSVTSWLTNKNIFPVSVTVTFRYLDGLLAITFYVKQDLDEFLDIVGYKYSCDKSGFIILPDTNTVFLYGIPLVKLYTLV